ncbi:MAG: preprotein translocase subunit SecE [bacterium]|nr:preprotein translocase subunit SecE [bacterium]
MNEQQKKNAQTASRNDFVAGVVTELRRVTWPTRDEWVTATVLTIGLVVGIGLFTFALDELFGHLFTLIRPAGL